MLKLLWLQAAEPVDLILVAVGEQEQYWKEVVLLYPQVHIQYLLVLVVQEQEVQDLLLQQQHQILL
jgi:hypothetical protein